MEVIGAVAVVCAVVEAGTVEDGATCVFARQISNEKIAPWIRVFENIASLILGVVQRHMEVLGVC